MHRPIAAFDIETVPDTALGRRLHGHQGDFRAVTEAMLARRLEETDQRSDFLRPPWHRIVAMAVAWLEPDTGRFKLGSLGDDVLDEGSMLEHFFRVLRPAGGRNMRPRLVSWNGQGFDLPVIRYRAMLHGIDAGAYYDSGDPRNGYVNRFHDLHTDLMDVLAGYGASEKMGLDELARVMGLPGKTLTEGHRVWLHISRGEWEIVRTYCELDALNTLMLQLAWERSTGVLSGDDFLRLRDVVAAGLADDPRPPVAEAGALLGDWQPGRERRALAGEPSLPQPGPS